MTYKISDEEKQAEIAAFREKQRRMAVRGKMIIIGIAALVGLRAVIGLFAAFGGFGTLVVAVFTIACAVALLNGVAWTRYLFIVSLVWDAIYAFVILISALPQHTHTQGRHFALCQYTGVLREVAPPPPEPVQTAAVMILFSIFVVCLVSALLLALSKSVKEYMYATRYA